MVEAEAPHMFADGHIAEGGLGGGGAGLGAVFDEFFGDVVAGDGFGGVAVAILGFGVGTGVQEGFDDGGMVAAHGEHFA